MTMEIGESSTKKLRALVVDDTNVVRRVVSHFLRSHKFEIVEAINGKEAVDLVRSGETFDLVTMDRSMPVMDGVTATKKLREMGAESKIIALTSDADFKDAFEEAGADKFFIKPLDRKKLAEVLGEFKLIPN